LWAIARYPDVQHVLKNPQLFSSSAFQAMLEPEWIPRNPMAHSILCLDPPEHTRRRALVARGFTSSAIAGLRGFIETVAEELVDTLLQAEGEVDFVAEMGAPLPSRVIAELIGLDPALHRKFRALGNALASITTAPPTPEQIATVVPCLEEMQAYMREVVQKRRAQPRDDMVSTLLEAELDGRRLTDEQLMTFLFILVPAGTETMSHLLSKAALTLARRPDDIALLRQRPELVPGYVEELLRFDPSIHALLRMAMDDTEIAGAKIARGSLVLALLASANRDPDYFDDPDRFDPTRVPGPHLGFGHGFHACLGASLARLETSIAIAALVRKCARIELRADEPLAWNTSLTIRGLDTLPVRCVPL
jgi:hypothetical protein